MTKVRDCHTVRDVDPETGQITFRQEERWLDIETIPPAEAQAREMQAASEGDVARSLEGQAAAALDGLRAYRDLANPTNGQTVAAVKLLCRVAIGLIRLRLVRFEAAD